MTERIVEYKYFTVRIKNQNKFDGDLKTNKDRYKTYKMIYKIMELERITIPEKYIEKKDKVAYISRLRKSGVKVVERKKKIDDEIYRKYYKVYSLVEKNSEYRKKLVELLLKKEIYKKETVEYEIDGVKIKKEILNNEEFIYNQIYKGIYKRTSDNLENEYTAILDLFSSYLMCDLKLASCLNGKNFNNKKDTTHEKSMYYYINKFNKKPTSFSIDKMNKESYEKYALKNKYRHGKWIKSKTYRHNAIYYSSVPNEYYNWDWLNKKWIKIVRPKLKDTGLIDIDKKYISEWVNVYNKVFEFDGNKYEISKKNIDYKMNKDNESAMGMVLCFKQDENIYFFNEKIFRLEDVKIKS